MVRNKLEERIPPKERSFADTLLCNALDIGEGLLKCGAEIQRVEDTVQRICHAYGAEHIEIFAITGMITASLRMPDGEYSSQMRRVYGSANDFRQLEDFNALSREICAETPLFDIVQDRISKIKQAAHTKKWIEIVGGVVGASGFAVFFGGNFYDAIASGVIGLVIMLLNITLFSHIGVFSRTLFNSFLSGILAESAASLHGGFHASIIMIATIMLLIPGSAFSNALRDLFSGDTFAGSARLVQAILLALTIAAGFSLAIVLFGGVA